MEEPPEPSDNLSIDSMIVLYREENGKIGYLTSAKLNGKSYQFDKHKAYQIIYQFKLDIENLFNVEAILGALSESTHTSGIDSH